MWAQGPVCSLLLCRRKHQLFDVDGLLHHAVFKQKLLIKLESLNVFVSEGAVVVRPVGKRLSVFDGDAVLFGAKFNRSLCVLMDPRKSFAVSGDNKLQSIGVVLRKRLACGEHKIDVDQAACGRDDLAAVFLRLDDGACADPWK